MDHSGAACLSPENAVAAPLVCSHNQHFPHTLSVHQLLYSLALLPLHLLADQAHLETLSLLLPVEHGTLLKDCALSSNSMPQQCQPGELA